MVLLFLDFVLRWSARDWLLSFQIKRKSIDLPAGQKRASSTKLFNFKSRVCGIIAALIGLMMTVALVCFSNIHHVLSSNRASNGGLRIR